MSIRRFTTCWSSASLWAHRQTYLYTLNRFRCSYKVVSRNYSLKTEGIHKNGIENTQDHQPRTKFAVAHDELHSSIVEGNVQLFDVRNLSDVESTGSIPGSVNIPLVELKKAFSLSDDEFVHRFGVSKPKLDDSNIVFYGLSDVTAASACEIAHNLGFKHITPKVGQSGQ
uniref:Rhodanese domain-containing protein n=1 Tax=Trichobilharzia regenti TaxID=157069 RepID=A0AA85JRG9_TRIRE|nr:unnamed protein product [Trichobilharzia regenti]